MPTAVAFGFLLAAPTINPIVVWSTWVAFRDQPEIPIFRVLFSLIIAVTLACIFSLQKDPQALLTPLLARRFQLKQINTAVNPEPTPVLLQSGTFLLGQGTQPLKLDENFVPNLLMTPPVEAKRWQVFLDNVIQELRELGGMLIIGSAIAASIQVFVPREIILSLGQDPITSILAMMLLAGIVSICSTVDSFFALSFAATFTTSSLLAFLVFGPMIDLKSMGLMLSIFKPRIIFYLFILAAQLTLILTLCHSYFF